MKKNKIIASTFLALLATSTIGSITSNAIDAGSKGRVGFTDADPNTPATPYDPTDPAFPPAEIAPEAPGEGGGTTGPLRFERVPNFDFGQIPIEIGAKTVKVYDEEYTPKSGGTAFYAAPTLEVTDGRGNAPGWTVKVENDGIFKATTAGVPDFKATISLNKAVANSYTQGVLATEAPTLNLSSPLKLTDAGSVMLAHADALKGNAKWGISFYDSADTAASTNTSGIIRPVKKTAAAQSDAVTLEIPSGVKVTKNENYSTSITWTLEDA